MATSQTHKKTRRFSVIEIKEVLESTGGFVTIAANKLGMDRTSLHARIARTPTLQEALKQIRESHLDLAESQLISKLKEKELGAICFYLKCQGKARGYVEQQHIKIEGEINFFEGVRKALGNIEEKSGKDGGQ